MPILFHPVKVNCLGCWCSGPFLASRQYHTLLFTATLFLPKGKLKPHRDENHTVILRIEIFILAWSLNGLMCAED